MTSPAPAPQILCLGEPLYELNQRADGTFLPGFGGDTSNVAISAARQGARVGYISRVGADSFGDAFIDLWNAEGVDITHVTRDRAAPTGIYFVTHDHNGHHFSYRRAGSAASKMVPADVPLETIRAARILHVTGISQAIGDGPADAVFTAIEAAKAAGVTVSYDTNLRLNLWPLDRARAVIHAAMSRCDIARPGMEDAAHLTGLTDPDKVADYYLTLGARIVALTLGGDGALIATPDERRRVGGQKVKPVDATGAGDCFGGAFLAELAAGRDPWAAAYYANAAAALSTQGYGAIAPIPRRADVEAFIASAAA